MDKACQIESKVIFFLLFTSTLCFWVYCLQETESRKSAKCMLLDSYGLNNVTSWSDNKSTSFSYEEIISRSIFFAETSGKGILNPRQACSIESMAAMHRENKIVVYHTAPELQTDDSFYLLLNNSFQNIIFEHLNLSSLFEKTPLNNWYKEKGLNSSKYIISHLSDAVRYGLLYKYGGVYSDLDIISLKPFPFYKNFIGWQDKTFINGAVLATEKDHPLLLTAMSFIKDNYKPEVFDILGPGLLTNMLRCLCGNDTRFNERNNYYCYGIQVFNSTEFYPINYQKWRLFFKNNTMSEISKYFSRSTTIHFWNALSKNTKISTDSEQPYSIIAKRYCPLTYSIAKKEREMLK